jgi:predicted nucleotidyltransferase
MTVEQRVSAAVEEIVAATDADQVVLFGSVAKGTARPDSDIDLLVIGDPARHADGKRTCSRTGDEVDVFVTDRASAERYQYSAAYLEGIALGEGRTVYAKHPERALAAGEAMVRRTLYDPDKAAEWVEDARKRLRRFETDDEDLYKCESLVDALERALKALIVAGGQRVVHRHGLDKLWSQAETIAGELPGGIGDNDLKELTKYSGEFLYPAQGARKLDPRRAWERFESPVRKVVAHAEQRVPAVVKKTLARIREETAAPPPRPRIS